MDNSLIGENNRWVEINNLRRLLRQRHDMMDKLKVYYEQKMLVIREVANVFRHTQVIRDPFSNKVFPKTFFGREVITREDLYDAWRDGNVSAIEHCKIQIAKALE